jgi:methylated-DNA-[protein]-cysteine S-methyltransferase
MALLCNTVVVGFSGSCAKDLYRKHLSDDHFERHNPMKISFTTLDTPIGLLRVYGQSEGQGDALLAILWDEETPRTYLDAALEISEIDDSPFLQFVSEQIMEYFRGQRMSFHIELAPRGTDFQRQAWRALREIPYGETRTYAAQAAQIGRPTAARAVGAANGQNPIPLVVPCHRVIGANGSLTGFAGGLDAKRWLLRHERRVSGIAAEGQLSILD